MRGEDDDGFTSYSQMAIDTAPTIDAVSEWIPCEERLPKDHELVCATVKWDDDETIELAVGYRFGDWYLMDRFGSTFNYGYTVLAWMPLPKPYGEREGE